MHPGMPELIAPYRERGLNSKAFGWRGLRTKSETYVINNGTHPDEPQLRLLYDLENDPYQLNPIVITQDNPICKRYDQQLKAYLKLIKDPFMTERNDQ